MSASPSSAREGARPIGLVHAVGLLCGILLLIAAALLYLGREQLFGMPARPLLLGLLAIGAIGLVPALRGLSAFQHIGGSTASRSRSSSPGGDVRPGEVLLRLSEPTEGQAEIVLLDAVRRAYRETQGSAAASFASFVGSSESDIAEMYATFIAEHVSVYGCKRPSSEVEWVSMTSPTKEFEIEDGRLILREREGNGIYEDLRIKAVDYPLVLARLRAEP